MTSAGTLERILDLSLAQLELLKEKRYAELLGCQEERDTLLAGLEDKDERPLAGDPGLKELARRIMENDGLIAMNAMTTSAELKERLTRFGRSKKAIKAYSSR